MYQEQYLSYLLSCIPKNDQSISEYKLVCKLLDTIPWYDHYLGVKHQVKTNSQIWDDLNLFKIDGPDTSKHKPICDYIDKSSTIVGKVFLQHLLSNPTTDTNVLKWRQHCIRHLNVSGLSQTIHREIADIKGELGTVLSFFSEVNKETQESYDTVLFNHTYLEILNKSDTILNVSNNLSIIVMPVFSILSPILSVLLPLIYLKVAGYIKVSWYSVIQTVGKYIYNYFWSSFFTLFSRLGRIGLLLGIGWLGLFLYGTYCSFKDAYTKYQVISDIHHKLLSVKKFVNGVNNIYYHSENKYIRDPIVQRALFHLCEDLNDTVLSTVPGITTDKGKILRIFNSMMSGGSGGDVSLNGCLSIVIQYFGLLDCYLGLSELVCGTGNFPDGKPDSRFSSGGAGGGATENDPYTYAVYLSQNNKPGLIAKDTWHPALTGKPKVFNEVWMDTNIILTGPNQGGKSTFIKSILLNIWLSQTISVTNAREFKLTPFGLINSYIKLVDTVGKESLFEAEMNRMKEFFDSLDKLEGKHSFVVIDEIFTSTNYEEGLSASIATAEEMLKYPNNLSILTTHYPQLTRINTSSSGAGESAFKNYQVMIHRGADGIKFLYKIVPGVSNERIALELLAKKGFSSGLLHRAQYHRDLLGLNKN